MAKTIEK